MPLFEMFGDLFDAWLGVDDTWEGDRLPRCKTPTTLNRLCREDRVVPDALPLLENLYGRLQGRWVDAGSPRCTGIENWRFVKQNNLADEPQGQEVPLERTIAHITSPNWANSIPTVSGVVDLGSNAIDLAERSGDAYTLFELKVNAETPLKAAFQILSYGMAYLWFRANAVALGYDPGILELLRAREVRLRVLAPPLYYSPECVWLRRLEASLTAGLEQFERRPCAMNFRFEVFPAAFTWHPANRAQEEVRKNLLWWLRNRRNLFAQE